jgi:muramoyltetrapeptide carboxypeptidase
MAERTARRIGVMAPASPITHDLAEAVQALAAERLGAQAPEIVFHPQCFESAGHFAGPDAARTAALVDLANDPALDAVWFARGGYGSARIAEAALDDFGPGARDKTFLGYSDTGAILGGLQARRYPHLAHGPLPADLNRPGGAAAVERALRWLVFRDPAAVEPQAAAAPTLAFNIAVLSSILGTPLQPRFDGRVLMLEEVSEHLYAVDRFLFQITSTPAVRRAAGVRLGRISAVPENDRPFGEAPEAMIRRWCAGAGLPYLGAADIGHDVDNKVVPFG